MLSGLRSAQTTKALVMSVPVSAIWVAPALFGRLTMPEVTVLSSAASPVRGTSHVPTESSAPSSSTLTLETAVNLSILLSNSLMGASVEPDRPIAGFVASLRPASRISP